MKKTIFLIKIESKETNCYDKMKNILKKTIRETKANKATFKYVSEDIMIFNGYLSNNQSGHYLVENSNVLKLRKHINFRKELAFFILLFENHEWNKETHYIRYDKTIGAKSFRCNFFGRLVRIIIEKNPLRKLITQKNYRMRFNDKCGAIVFMTIMQVAKQILMPPYRNSKKKLLKLLIINI